MGYIKQEKQKLEFEKMIIDSFIFLFEKKSFDDITVSLICDKADISRRTFYRHYKSKEEVLDSYIENLCINYFYQFKDAKDVRLSSVAFIFFSYWERYKDFLMALNRDNKVDVLKDKFNLLLPKVYQAPNMKPISTDDMNIRKYMAIFSSGAFINLLFVWINGGCKENAYFMKDVVSKIIDMNM